MSKYAGTRSKFRTSDFGSLLSAARARPQGFIFPCLLAMLVGALCNSALAGIGDSWRYQSGVRNSAQRALNAKQIERLLKSLREKTGFLGMHFDEQGFLRLGDRTKIAGGSAAARELLIAAVDRGRAIDLENYDRSSIVAFAQLAKSVVFMSLATGMKIEVYPIQIDFSDFAHLRGDKVVLAAFDIGFVVLHELAHAVLDLHDSFSETGGPGECEDYINRIRRELGLPERQNYVARTFRMAQIALGKPQPQAELLFARTVEQEGRARTQSFNLTWEAEMVGAVRTVDFKPSSVAATNRKPAAGSAVAAAP